MKHSNPFRDLSKFEFFLWLLSITVCIGAYFLSGKKDSLTVTASLIGVTALIFVAKGYVLGQVLTVVFAIFYGIVSFFLRYYGEMITYLGMTAPIAVLSVISWIRNPFQGTKEVTVAHLSKKQYFIIIALSIAVTILFYFVLNALGNANMFFSTLSVTTSFLASALTLYRSPYYALAYSANDIILIILWSLASAKNISYLPMIFCFIMFLVNDLYGFYNWNKIKKRQRG